ARHSVSGGESSYLIKSIDLCWPGSSVTRIAFGYSFLIKSTSCGGNGSLRSHSTRRYSPGAPLNMKTPCSFVDPFGRIKAGAVDGSTGINMTNTWLNGVPPDADNTRPVKIEAGAITIRTSLISDPALVLSFSRNRSTPLTWIDLA